MRFLSKYSLNHIKRIQKSAFFLLGIILGFSFYAPTFAEPQIASKPAQKKHAPSAEEQLSDTLEKIEKKLARLEKKLAKKQDATLEKDELKKLHQKITKLDKQAIESFRKIEKRLRSKGLSGVIIKRHQKAVATYKAEIKILKANLGSIETAKDDGERRVRAKEAKGDLEGKRAKHRPQSFDKDHLPSKIRRPNRSQKPRISRKQYIEDGLYDESIVRVATHGNFDISNLVGADNPVYLSQTPEIVFTESIVQGAAVLKHNPIKIYEFIKNRITWVPAWGAYQSAEQTLINGKGGSVDISSLFITLLRASGIPARYVHGTIDVPADKFMNWVGGFTDANSAWDFASSTGLPFTAVRRGGKIIAFRMEHVWVEAAIDFQPSRGVVNKVADTWVQLDPSFKDLEIFRGSSITGEVPFNVIQYLSVPNSYSPVLDYHIRISEHILTQNPGSISGPIEHKTYTTPKKNEIRQLPTGLAYSVVLPANRYAGIPVPLRGIASFEFLDQYGSQVSNYLIPYVELVGNRLTLSYLPATANDEELVISYGGSIYDVPPYLLYLTPTLKINGSIVFTGPSLQMGERQKLQFRATGPGLSLQGIAHNVVVGSYMGIAINANGIDVGGPGKNNERLWNNVTNKLEADVSYDELVGEYLHAIAQNYFVATDKRSESLGGIYNTVFMRMPSEGAALLSPVISYFFGVPRSASPSQLQLDVPAENYNAVARDGNDQNRRSYLEIRGLEGSYNEGDVFTQISNFSTVSSVKAIQYANQQGIPVYRINASNIETIFPNLQLGSEDLSEIRNGINAGLEAIVPQREMTIGDWTGVGYIIRDPNTFSGAYRISGSLSGSNNTGSTISISQLAKLPYLYFKKSLDAIFQGGVKFAALAHVGSKIADSAGTFVGEGYDTVDQCSGLVRLAYKAAGICLDPWTYGCKVSQISEKDWVDNEKKNGVFMHHWLANKQKILKSVRATNNPLPGDIVFFNDTTGPGHPLNHEGIVLTDPDQEGTVQIIQAGFSGVTIGNMNILQNTENTPPSNSNYNMDLGGITKGVCGQKCRAGALFEGYGTIRNGK